MVFYFDMDGVLVNMPEFHGTESFQKLRSPYWVSNLPPYSYNVNVIRWLIDQGHKVYILSRAMNDANKRGKVAWLEKYVPNLDKNNIILIEDTHKESYMREKGILVDDIERNCKNWYYRGAPSYWVKPKGANIDVKKLLSIKC